MTEKIYYIDGNDFSTLEEFLRLASNILAPDTADGWMHSLDAFNDWLYRGDEKPDAGFMLVWKNSTASREKLGYAETIKQLETKLRVGHPANRTVIQGQIAQARSGSGQTVFDTIIEIIRAHPDIRVVLK